jgi:hypothetical protein
MNFGTLFSFNIQDDAGVINPIVYLGARRNGADNSGDFGVYNFSAGVGSYRFWVDKDGLTTVGTAKGTGRFNITGSTDIVQLKVIANATQTTDVLQVLASDGTTVRLSQDTKGYLKIGNTTGANNVMILGATNGVPASQTGNFVTAVGDKAGKALTSGASNVLFGYNSGALLSSGGSNIFLGANAGNRQTTNSNLLIIDNQDRTSVALEATNALIYGVFNATPANQTLTVNGALSIGQASGQSSLVKGLIINSGSGNGATDALVVNDNVTWLIKTDPSIRGVGLFGATPIAKPTTGITSATYVNNGGTGLTNTDTFDGYTLAQIARALKNLGILT